MSNKKFNILKFIANYLIILISIFALITIIFAGLLEFINRSVLSGKDLLIFFIVSAVASILFSIVFKLNNISIVLQAIIIYFLLSLIVVLVGYYVLYIYDIGHNYKLFISTIIFIIVGLVFLILFLLSYEK